MRCPSHLKQDSCGKLLRSTQYPGKACRSREASVTFPTLKLFRELPLSGEAARRQEERRCGAMRAGSAGTPGAIGPLRSVCPGAPGPRKPAGSAQPRTAPHRTARGAAASIPSAGLGPGVGRPGRPARGCAPAATPARTASGGAGPRLGARSPETRAGDRDSSRRGPCEDVRV